MTKPITHRPLKRPGGKPSKPPANALALVREYAADGFSVVGVAAKLGTTPKTFNKWLEAQPELQDAFDAGRESERWALHNKLFRLAMEQDNAPAAMFLLKARHGYREGDQSAQGGGVSVTIALPGAMSREQYAQKVKGTIDGQR
ncbi:hypothetical protein [Croceicoccus naphthovorans]|uniref:hypothetical protein n=1 Tax=Croceicoccus naphthovorans TaxID=1348774 RepID=UPI0012E02B90|nr:hypothetical protein [Croceicoccus naphthovorans]MBB3990853.1 transposase-like protein [Croceicoccus naphthovorans]